MFRNIISISFCTLRLLVNQGLSWTIKSSRLIATSGVNNYWNKNWIQQHTTSENKFTTSKFQIHLTQLLKVAVLQPVCSFFLSTYYISFCLSSKVVSHYISPSLLPSLELRAGLSFVIIMLTEADQLKARCSDSGPWHQPGAGCKRPRRHRKCTLRPPCSATHVSHQTLLISREPGSSNDGVCTKVGFFLSLVCMNVLLIRLTSQYDPHKVH